MLNIPPHLEACRPRGLFSIFHGTSSPVARRCPRASDLVLSAEHAFLLYERPGLHLQSGASAVGGVQRGARRQVWAGLADPMRISIRAPRAGCDQPPPMYGGGEAVFQSTHPVRGATPCLVDRQLIRIISIHAPRAGRDRASPTLSARKTVFQSTRPVWGATANLTILPRQICTKGTKEFLLGRKTHGKKEK